MPAGHALLQVTAKSSTQQPARSPRWPVLLPPRPQSLLLPLYSLLHLVCIDAHIYQQFSYSSTANDGFGTSNFGSITPPPTAENDADSDDDNIDDLIDTLSREASGVLESHHGEDASTESRLHSLARHVYNLAGADHSGRLTGVQLRPLMLMSKLSVPLLSAIWNAVDVSQQGSVRVAILSLD